MEVRENPAPSRELANVPSSWSSTSECCPAECLSLIIDIIRCYHCIEETKKEENKIIYFDVMKAWAHTPQKT